MAISASFSNILGKCISLLRSFAYGLPPQDRTIRLLFIPVLVPVALFSLARAAAAMFRQELLVFLRSLNSADAMAISSKHHKARASQPLETIERALTQTLRLVSDMSSTSRKYSFTRSLAEDMLQQNADAMVDPEINRRALVRAFTHTMQQLELALQSELGASHVSQVLDAFTVGWRFFFSRPNSSSSSISSSARSNESNQSTQASASYWPRSSLLSASSPDSTRPEKLAVELAWLVGNMTKYGGVDEAVQFWSHDVTLAEASLLASPRVQRSLVRLTALLCKAIAKESVLVSPEVKFRVTHVWLPLLCRAAHGVDGPIFTISEQKEVERALEQIIAGMPAIEQERVFCRWLHEFSWSPSDWPNLEGPFRLWCHAARSHSVIEPDHHLSLPKE